MKLISYCNRIIEYSFYLLFFLVPLVFAGSTSELFEFNKMWVTFGLTTIIGTAWISKMILQKEIFIRRTPLDIPILLFLLSQLIATLFSLDSFISWWGYYTRWNGGFLSLFSYVFLYYAFVSNLVNHEHETTSFKKIPYAFAWVVLVGSFLITLGINGTDQASAESRSNLLLISLLIAFGLMAWSYRGSALIKVLFFSLNSGLIVALWAIPSHFGFDPTCLVFRGKLDTACWTDAFKPTIRAFSTLGQPAWLAAYMATLLPLSMAFFLNNTRKRYLAISFLLLTAIFYLDLVYANTRAGILGFWITNILFWTLLGFDKLTLTKKVLLIGLFLLCSGGVIFFLVKLHHILFWSLCIAAYFIILTTVFTRTYWRYILIFMVTFWFLTAITNQQLAGIPTLSLVQNPTPQQNVVPITNTGTGEAASDSGITDSGKIRLYVWRGAIDAWKANPIFGTGVETFAFAYYKFRPVEHNLTSEWDYLYNKAHNEYLNYLTTTGIFGLGTYLAFIALFMFYFFKYLLTKMNVPSHPQQNKHDKHHSNLSPLTSHLSPLNIALFTGWCSILITNFFGFSVVIINLYLFLIPAFFFILTGLEQKEKSWKFSFGQSHGVNPYQWTTICIVIVISGFFLIRLINYWNADVAYALGTNLDHVGSYQEAYPLLTKAVKTEQSEPVYKDELAVNLATLATALYGQKDSSNAAVEATNNALALSNEITTDHPNNISFWKSRVRILYALAQTDPAHQQEYMQQAFQAIMKAYELAPTDPRVSYNLGVLYGQLGESKKGIEVLTKTVAMKPDYRDAYIALGVLYHAQAVDKDEKVIDPAMLDKAISTYEYILKNLSPNDKEVKAALQKWKTP